MTGAYLGAGWVARGLNTGAVTCNDVNYVGAVVLSCDASGHWQTAGSCEPGECLQPGGMRAS
jgi:hypothetical protein